jgi:hypothetical protein
MNCLNPSWPLLVLPFAIILGILIAFFWFPDTDSGSLVFLHLGFLLCFCDEQVYQLLMGKMKGEKGKDSCFASIPDNNKTALINMTFDQCHIEYMCFLHHLSRWLNLAFQKENSG